MEGRERERDREPSTPLSTHPPTFLIHLTHPPTHPPTQPNRYTLELMSGRQLGPNWAASELKKGEGECLARKHCLKKTSSVAIKDCHACGAKGWNLEPSGRISQDNGRYVNQPTHPPTHP